MLIRLPFLSLGLLFCVDSAEAQVYQNRYYPQIQKNYYYGNRSNINPQYRLVNPQLINQSRNPGKNPIPGGVPWKEAWTGAKILYDNRVYLRGAGAAAAGVAAPYAAGAAVGAGVAGALLYGAATIPVRNETTPMLYMNGKRIYSPEIIDKYGKFNGR